VATAETRTNTSYGALATAGPSVTVTLPTGSTRALVSVTSGIQGSTGSVSCYMSFLVNGAGTLAAMDARALILVSNNLQQSSASFVVTGLSAGSNTFTAQYRGSSASADCTYSNRSIWAIPLP
jgi:hypothetical protein